MRRQVIGKKAVYIGWSTRLNCGIKNPSAQKNRKVPETMEIKFTKVVYWLAVIAGLALSIVSQLKICSACSATANFSIFGMQFGWFGIVFFVVLLAVSAVRHRFSAADPLALLMVFSAAGAEARFIWLQKYVIEQWCPVCLWIATAVFTAAAVLFHEKYTHFRRNGGEMKALLKQLSVMSLAFILGLTVAILGVNRQDADAAAVNQFLGKTDSTTTVYFVSDWFCPVCQKVEPRIEQIFPEIAKTAKVGFVDFPIHRETLNFTPYNLQFIFYEKDKYLDLRKALSALALKTRNPTPVDVQQAVAPYGVKVREMNYADILYGMQADQAVYKGFGVKATPSVVVTDSKTGKTKILVGDNEINLQAVKAAITMVRNNKK